MVQRSLFCYLLLMGRGDYTTVEISGLQHRSSPAPEENFAGFTREESIAYIENVIKQSGAKADDVIIVRLTTTDQLGLGPRIIEAAERLGLPAPHILPAEHLMSNEELASVMPLEEERMTGRGVEIYFSPLIGAETINDGYAHDDYCDLQEGKSEERREMAERLRVAQDQMAEKKLRRYNISLWPNRAWAEKVFPEAGEAAEKELAKLLKRVTFTNDPEGLRSHLAKVEKRKSRVNEMIRDGFNLARISTPPAEGISHPLNRGTDLRMEIAPDSQFISAHFTSSLGDDMLMNNPSDEVWGTPLRSSVEGHFTTTRPFVVEEGGQRIAIEGIYGEFKDGKLVRIEAFDSQYNDILAREFNINADPPSDVLGELGLVDSSGPLAQAKHPDGRPRTFFHNLLDENTGVHIGFGKSYQNHTGGTGDIAPVTGNVHKDLVIGDARTSVTFANAAGQERPVISEGLWHDE